MIWPPHPAGNRGAERAPQKYAENFFAFRVVRGMFFFVAAASKGGGSAWTRDWRRRRGGGLTILGHGGPVGRGEKISGAIRHEAIEKAQNGEGKGRKRPITGPFPDPIRNEKGRIRTLAGRSWV